MKPTRLTFYVLGAALPFVAQLTVAADWPQWRGPAFNGSSPETGLPSTFDKTNNVMWSCPMPGPSGATPVISGDHVFVASTDEKARTCVAIAIDRKTGHVLWQKKIADGYSKDRMSTFSNSSPVTDGRNVWFFYATGDLVCLDFEGKEIWRRNIQKDYGQFAFNWTFSSTPLLWDGKLYLQVLQRNEPVQGRGEPNAPSFLLAFDPMTGKELWKVIRPGQAQAESMEAFTTPTPAAVDGRTELLVVGGDCVTGHDPATGAELWRWGTWNPTRIGHWRLVPSVVTGGGVALVCAPKDAPIYAVKLGGKGRLTNADLDWQSYVQSTEDPAKAARSLETKDLTSDVPTPLFYDGKFYVLNGNKRKLLCVDPSGKVVWSGNLPGRAVFQASPTGADGKIYMMNFAGDVFVAQAGGAEFKLLHTAAMGENEDMLRASIPTSHAQLFIRTSKQLYCIGRR